MNYMCYFVPCKVLLIFERALRSRGQCPGARCRAILSQIISPLGQHLSLGEAAGAPVTQINLAAA